MIASDIHCYWPTWEHQKFISIGPPDNLGSISQPDYIRHSLLLADLRASGIHLHWPTRQPQFHRPTWLHQAFIAIGWPESIRHSFISANQTASVPSANLIASGIHCYWPIWVHQKFISIGWLVYPATICYVGPSDNITLHHHCFLATGQHVYIKYHYIWAQLLKSSLSQPVGQTLDTGKHIWLADIRWPVWNSIFSTLPACIIQMMWLNGLALFPRRQHLWCWSSSCSIAHD